MQNTTQAPARPRSTKAYRKLVDRGLSDGEALTVLGRPDLIRDAEVAAVDVATDKPAKKGKKKAKSKGVSLKKDPAKVVAKRGYDFTSGRIYANGAVAEGIARVLRSGGFEIVQTSGTGRTAAVLIEKRDSGDVSVQNLRRA